jgi:hypothetical protein
MAAYQQPRHDLTKYPIQDEVWLEVYWRDDRAGRGPCASLYARDVEVLRFDCFGDDQGHCHVNIEQNRGQRWYYPAGTVRQHIDQSAFDLSKNVPFALRSHQDPAIQEMRIDPAKLSEAASQMRETMLGFAEQLKL